MCCQNVVSAYDNLAARAQTTVSNIESRVLRAVTFHSSHHPQRVILAQLSLLCSPMWAIHSFIHPIMYLFVFVYLRIRGPSEPMLSEQIPIVPTNIIPTWFLMSHMDRVYMAWYIWDIWHCSIAGCRLAFMVTHCLVLYGDWLGCRRAVHTYTDT